MRPPRPPAHRNPGPDRTACAPYNFVPLPEVVVPVLAEAELHACKSPQERQALLDERLPDHDRYHPGRHTGYFDVTLTTRSPLYVRCPLPLGQFLRQERQEDTSSPFREQVRNLPDFFYTRDPSEPVLPGSSLRGMLRGLLEIVSYGKVRWVTQRQLFFRTVDPTSVGDYYRSRMANKVEGGFLHPVPGGGHSIRVCEVARVYRDRLGQRLYDGSGPNGTPRWAGQPRQWAPVWVRLDEQRPGLVANLSFRSEAGQGWREGRLVITGDAPRKKKEFVFLLPAAGAEEVPVPEDRLERFQDDDQLTQWQQKAFPRDRPDPQCRPRDGLLRSSPPEPGDPVFFLREGGALTFFGRAGMFRLPYQRCPLDFVPAELRRSGDIDYAEAVFGYTRGRESGAKQGDKERAYAGRVFVSDARLERGQARIWETEAPLVPSILATPKPTAFQHYLTQEEPDRDRRLYHYGSPEGATALRGHKLYWHQGPRRADDLRAQPGSPNVGPDGRVEDASTQHTQFRPVAAGVRFGFRVHFENLSDAELGALCWVLHPLGEPGKDYCHSLGMGKPLGMGAVKLEAVLYRTDRTQRYTGLFEGERWQTGVGPGEPLSDRAVLERLTGAFERHLLGALRPAPACEHLFGLRRIAMLLKLLEWPGFPPELPATPANRARTREGRPNTRYMTVQLAGVPGNERNEYRYRPVLPDPSAFGGLCGQAVPGVAPAPAGPAAPGGGGEGRPGTGAAPARGSPRPAPGTSPAPRPLQSGDAVEVVVAPDPRDKGRLFARHEPSGLVGPVLNPADVPEVQRQVGQRLTLIVHSVNVAGKQIAFRWGTPPARPAGGSGTGGRPRRR